MKQLVLVLLLLSGGVAVVAALQPITVAVRPTVTSAQGSTRVLVRVDSNETNRQLVWEVDGADYYRSSSIQLDGASAPRSFFFTVSSVPEGEYSVRATVIRNNDSKAMAETKMVVVGMASLGN